jgi:hypothetical protein
VQKARPRRAHVPHLPDRNRRKSKKLAALARAAAQSHETSSSKPPQQQAGGKWADALAGLAAVLPDSAQPQQQIAYLWPCNVHAWQCWQSVQTQWRVGPGGATGLDYAGAMAHLQTAHQLRGKKLRNVWACITAAEAATLEVWAQQRKDREDQQQQQQPPTT